MDWEEEQRKEETEHAQKGEVGGRLGGGRKLCILETVRWNDRQRKEESSAW